MTDIVERARAVEFDSVGVHLLCYELADEIERLRSERLEAKPPVLFLIEEIERLRIVVKGLDRDRAILCEAKNAEIAELQAEIGRLQDKCDQFAEQLALRQKTALEIDMQEIMQINNGLKAEIERLRAAADTTIKDQIIAGHVDAFIKQEAEIERLQALKHTPKIGGPPCPTCGFVITSKKAEPFRYEDEE